MMAMTIFHGVVRTLDTFFSYDKDGNLKFKPFNTAYAAGTPPADRAATTRTPSNLNWPKASTSRSRRRSRQYGGVIIPFVGCIFSGGVYRLSWGNFVVPETFNERDRQR